MNARSISLILAAIGAINWGLIGVADFNLVAYLFGSIPYVEKVIYALVGLSGVYILYREISSYNVECVADEKRYNKVKRKY